VAAMFLLRPLAYRVIPAIHPAVTIGVTAV